MWLIVVRGMDQRIGRRYCNRRPRPRLSKLPDLMRMFWRQRREDVKEKRGREGEKEEGREGRRHEEGLAGG